MLVSLQARLALFGAVATASALQHPVKPTPIVHQNVQRRHHRRRRHHRHLLVVVVNTGIVPVGFAYLLAIAARVVALLIGINAGARTTAVEAISATVPLTVRVAALIQVLARHHHHRLRRLVRRRKRGTLAAVHVCQSAGRMAPAAVLIGGAAGVRTHVLAEEPRTAPLTAPVPVSIRVRVRRTFSSGSN